MTPVTLVALAEPDLAAIRALLDGLPRDGIMVRSGGLVLETSYPGGPGFYATAWRATPADAPLLFGLGACGLLLTRGDDIICCGDWDLDDVADSVAYGRIICAATPAALARILF